MPRTFSVEYSQGDSGPGELRIDFDGNVQVLTASGRLDAVGNRVVSPKFVIGTHGELATVECIRTSSSTLRVLLVIHLNSYASPAYERVLEEVSIDFR